MIPKAASMSPWAVSMVPKSVSLSVSILSNTLDQQSTGLYRDDRLVLLRNTSKQKTDQIRKDIIKIFKDASFKTEIETNLHIVNLYR